MSGLQLDAIPDKNVDYIRDFVALVKSIQVGDVQEMIETLSIDQDVMWSCIGSSGHTSSDGPAPGDEVGEDVEDDDVHGRSTLAFGRSRT